MQGINGRVDNNDYLSSCIGLEGKMEAWMTYQAGLVRIQAPAYRFI